MTEAACEFVTPLTFETLSENKVRVGMFSGGDEIKTGSPVEHVELAKWPDLVVIAPATANTIAAIATGRADNMLTTLVAAYDGRVLIAPAINDVMWANEPNQRNLAALSNRGVGVVPPETGDLACGYEAAGRMAEPEAIFAAINNQFHSDFQGIRVLVSSGGTEEDIDPVRVISNRSSGKMGFAVAEAARDMGADVTVVAANTSVKPPHGVRVEQVRTTAQMSSALKELCAESDVLVMAAAVSDFKLAAPFNEKVKGDSLTLDLTRTEDILATLGNLKKKQLIVGFALETGDAQKNALQKLEKKNCDMIVVNNPLEAGAAFMHDTNVVTIYNSGGEIYRSGAPESKRAIAITILTLATKEKAFKKLLD
jgi:phosphopantothenoylcysteine decarboxylase/phosphopantothenate--cysteine ligase